MSRISPGSHPGRSLQWPSSGQQNTTRTASKTVFSHSVTNLTPCCQIYRMLVCIYMWQLWCSERQGGREGGSRQRRRVRWSSGQNIFLPGVSHCRKAKLLPDLGIHPCSYPSRLLVFRSLSFHSSFHLQFFFFFLVTLLVFSHSFILALVAVGPAGRHGTG